jgi:hypothetical protein
MRGLLLLLKLPGEALVLEDALAGAHTLVCTCALPREIRVALVPI